MNIKVAIIGKPNVGKSTIFNRLCRRRLAITHDRSGVTRDCKVNTAYLGALEFDVMDTPGLDKTKSELFEKMFIVGINSAKNADLILFVVDGRNGIDDNDTVFAKEIRKLSKPIILLVNKAENPKLINHNQTHRLGFDKVVFISAEHNQGFDHLEELIRPHIPNLPKAIQEGGDDPEQIDNEVAPVVDEPVAAKTIMVSIIGRPNVGKSTLFNKLLGFERSITSSISGTTRDAISHRLTYRDNNIELIDTAGLRKKVAITDSVEELSAAESINAVRRSHIVALIIDGTCPLEKQDLSILRVAINEGKAVVMIINKYDLIDNHKAYQLDIEEFIAQKLFEIKGLPIIYISALKDKNFNKIWHTVVDLTKVYDVKIGTGQLNRVLEDATSAHIPQLASNGRRIRLKYITQTANRPPTFTIFGNMVTQLPQSYIRYIYNSIREKFKLYGVPIRIRCKNSNNPYENENSSS